VNENENEWLRFSRPTAAEFEKLSQLMHTLVPGNIKASKRKPKDAVARGGLALILKKTEVDLESDYAENLAESGNAHYKFDYVVAGDSTDPSQLEILTRLYSPEKPGNMFYRRMVRRTGDDEYFLWT
jgi:hypothetical protein